MNGVAKQFWNEIYDLQAPVPNDERRVRPARAKKKAVRRSQTRKSNPRAA